MLTQEDDVEIHALAARGWSVSAIARHTDRDRKTVRRYLAGEGAGQRREPVVSCLEEWRDYLTARFVEDPHVPAVALFDELAAAGFALLPDARSRAAAPRAATGLPGLSAAPRPRADGRA